MDKLASIQWLDETESTQDVLLRAVQSYDNLSVVAARLQTAGRGQRGNSWLAGKGENLTFSVLLKFGAGGFPSLPVARQFSISETVSSGICDYLESKGIDARIKWPNDIYVRNRKICGILVENTLNGTELSSSVVGIGLNVNQKDFPPQLVNPTSMFLLTGRKFVPEEELPLLLDSIFPGGGMPDRSGSYRSRLYRFGEYREYVDCVSGETFTGRITGVTERGLLQVQNIKGELKEFAFKEISYII
ncbi:MAG: biotin--[acetyl-CoA-carboxylase] ligase [Bacteroidales bacterium]|nr:biotin--[acetyl-CoA-carboxylase] ligase [Bacteroidales bacterium]